jgi:hypothetical protein
MSKAPNPTTVIETTKVLLADDSKRIELDDFVSGQVATAFERLGLDRFPQSAPVTEGSFPKRLSEYEQALGDLLPLGILLGKWARGDQLRILRKMFARLGSADKGGAGATLWIHLTWYPIQLLAYTAGIAALEAENYDALAAILLAPCRYPNSPSGEMRVPIVRRLTDEMTQINDAFKTVPGHEREYVPRSEYLFDRLRAPLDRELLLGADYEELFDRFEVLTALVYADLTAERRGGVWGPIGRFGYKYARGGSANPYSQLVSEVEGQMEKWPPLRVGFLAARLDASRSFRKHLPNDYQR